MHFIKVLFKSIKRLPLRFLIRDLVHWEPNSNLKTGYTIIIGCMHKLPELAIVNLRLLEKSNAASRANIFLVFDCSHEELDGSVHALVDELSDRIDVRAFFYSKKQIEVSRKIDWGWVYAWMSWTIGISHSTTKHVLLHDLDALPLTADIFETCYQNCLGSKAKFQGIQTYQGNGVTTKMGLATTFQLVIDVEHLRDRYTPIDVFNKVLYVDGRYIDFDTFLYAQWQSGDISVSPIDESQLFHPTQMICQFTDFMSGRDTLGTVQHNLLPLIYMQYLGGNSDVLARTTKQLENNQSGVITFNGQTLRIDHLSKAQWAWLEKQIRRLEQALYLTTRDSVGEFLVQFSLRAEDQRSVGIESIEEGGVADI